MRDPRNNPLGKRSPRLLSWLPRLGVACLLAVPAWSSSGQTRIVTDAEALATGRSQTVVVTQRPLRTFRGETVRIGRYAEAERAIGVVRPLRVVPNAYGDSDRFRRSYGDYRGYRTEKEIGVIRPFITYDPPVRHAPKTYTNPHAQPVAIDRARDADDSALPPRPTQTVLGQDVNVRVVTAITPVEVPAADRDDAWALLDQGYYREARQQFALLGDADDTITRTGHALAAALSGDLAGGVALMPAAPALPVGTVFADATTQRLDQTRQFLYADQPAMQAKLQSLLDLASPVSVSAN